eukprot:CAMPEP_0180549776 /NCGR_PEP_ID=MMETSP1036_2-20121128/72291_1 /TAXON_ID=632150 /ORGANISM="Azadinium spinosum, Strain 3D9" /LENGTH=456 /DNA_ID=CAMNT_0022564983 /DNA_START=91 /DNA_END=1458 /DNA_ORIENTATION=+
MSHHFATSWLQSLSAKLESLVQWSWVKDNAVTHRNLFRDFFSAPFQKCLALVDERKKDEFLIVIEKNLYKFDEKTQQFPLGCLCALLQHGKESPKTQEKVAAWVDFLLDELRRGPGIVVAQAVEECLSAPFQKFLALMAEPLKERLADGLGERLSSLDEGLQKKVLEGVSAVPARLESLVATCTSELNTWLEKAPRYPATPLAIVDSLAKMKHPLVKHFTAVKDSKKKESFLVAVALALSALSSRFRWMNTAEPDLESLSGHLQQHLFTVEGQPGPVMEMWLSARLKKYNGEVNTRLQNLFNLGSDTSRSEHLRTRLLPLFPDRAAASASEAASDTEAGWLTLSGSSALSDAIIEWLTEVNAGFFCPQHTISSQTILVLLQRFGRSFETDISGQKARLSLAPVVPQAQLEPPPPPPSFPPLPPPATSSEPRIIPPLAFPGGPQVVAPVVGSGALPL